MNPTDLQKEKGYRGFLIAVLGIFFLMYMMTLDLIGLPLSILRSYAPILIFAVMGIGFYRGAYGRRNIFCLGLIFVLWYVVTRILLGDSFLGRSFVTVVDLCILYGFAFPFARLFGDGEKRRVLDILALVYVVFFAVMAWLSVYFSVTRTGVTMPLSGEYFGLPNGTWRLQILGQNPNYSAVLVTLAFFLTVYLLAGHWKKRWIAPAVLAMLGFYWALALTDSRTSIVAFVACFAYVAAVLASKIRLRSKALKTAVVVAAAVLGLLVSYKGIGLSIDVLSKMTVAITQPQIETSQADGQSQEAVQAQALGDYQLVAARDIKLDEANMSGRTNVYSSVIPALRQNPKILLLGQLDSNVMAKITEICGIEYQHMHNSFLQVLMLMGVPGLLFALWLTIRLALITIKLLFGKSSTADKLLPLIPVALLVMSLVETMVFVPWMSMCWSLVNFLFLMVSGYLMEIGQRVKFRDLLKR